MSVLVQKYNDLLIRYDKAAAYMDSDASDVDKDKWEPEFQKILAELCEVYNRLMEG